VRAADALDVAHPSAVVILVPLPAKVENHAVLPGMDPTEDAELLWIPKASLAAPMPPHWIMWWVSKSDASCLQCGGVFSSALV
jgi:hypothetical protein